MSLASKSRAFISDEADYRASRAGLLADVCKSKTARIHSARLAGSVTLDAAARAWVLSLGGVEFRFVGPNALRELDAAIDSAVQS